MDVFAFFERMGRELVTDLMTDYKFWAGKITSEHDMTRLQQELSSAIASYFARKKIRRPCVEQWPILATLKRMDSTAACCRSNWSVRRQLLRDRYIDPALKRFQQTAVHPPVRVLSNENRQEMRRSHLEIMDAPDALLGMTKKSKRELADYLAAFSFHVLGWH